MKKVAIGAGEMQLREYYLDQKRYDKEEAKRQMRTRLKG
jgi:hypothetical protein